MLDTATIEIVEESWAKAAALGADKVGVLLFKNIFTIAPAAINLFVSFKDEENLYESPKLEAHGIKVGMAASGGGSNYAGSAGGGAGGGKCC